MWPRSLGAPPPPSRGNVCHSQTRRATPTRSPLHRRLQEGARPSGCFRSSASSPQGGRWVHGGGQARTPSGHLDGRLSAYLAASSHFSVCAPRSRPRGAGCGRVLRGSQPTPVAPSLTAEGVAAGPRRAAGASLQLSCCQSCQAGLRLPSAVLQLPPGGPSLVCLPPSVGPRQAGPLAAACGSQTEGRCAPTCPTTSACGVCGHDIRTFGLDWPLPVRA